jgi:hypothetical protein
MTAFLSTLALQQLAPSSEALAELLAALPCPIAPGRFCFIFYFLFLISSEELFNAFPRQVRPGQFSFLFFFD